MATKREDQLSDEAIENLENQIPEIATAATRLAYFRAVAAGHTVVTVKNNHILATHADGHLEVLAKTKPGQKVKTGQRFSVRKLSGRP